MTAERAMTFNSAIECGMRALCILLPAYPRSLDLQRLTAFDHLVVHTGDIGGPESLHPQLPMRNAEILVRRRLVERGVYLMVSRGLVDRVIQPSGIEYRAADMAETFMMSLTAPYLRIMRERGEWVLEHFGEMETSILRDTMKRVFGQWIEEFQAAQRSLSVNA
jgi:hypothetical protein